MISSVLALILATCAARHLRNAILLIGDGLGAGQIEAHAGSEFGGVLDNTDLPKRLAQLFEKRVREAGGCVRP